MNDSPKAADTTEIGMLLDANAMVTIGSSVRIARWVPRCLTAGDPTFELQLIRPDAFNTTLTGRYYDVSGQRLPLPKLLLSRMRKYDGLAFLPGDAAVVSNKLNLWRGLGIEPAEGKWLLMEAHVRDVLANGVTAYATYMLRLLAWAVQNPGRRAEVALVLRGGKGAGKGILGTTMLRMFGLHGCHVSNRKHLTSGFNRHLMYCCLLFADEAYWPGDQSAEGELKRLITEPTLTIEPKGVDAFEVNNCLHLIISGNADWVIPASDDERRYAVFLVSGEHAKDLAYFHRLTRELDNGGREAMLFDLLAMPLGDWHPRQDVPDTDALYAQKEQGQRGVTALIAALLDEGCLPAPARGRPDVCLTADGDWGRGLWSYAQHTIPSLRHTAPKVMKTELSKVWNCLSWRSHGRRGVIFPALADIRQLYVAKYGPQPDWDFTETWSDEGASDG